jgi:RNA polymerase primary sigma factor
MKKFQVSPRITPRQEGVHQLYLREVQETRPLSSEEEAELALKISQGDREALEKLVCSNLRFVISVAKSYTSDAEILQDLIAVGNIGLYESAPKFDPSLGFRFCSYAVWHIRKEMIKYLHTHIRTIRVPGTNLQLLSKIKKFLADKEAENGGYLMVDFEEILAWVRTCSKDTHNFTAEKLREILSFLPDVLSYDEPLTPDSETSWLDLHSPQPTGNENPIEQAETLALMHQALDQLQPIQAYIIKAHLGINELQTAMFYDDIGKELKKDGEWVRNQYKKGIQRLKRIMFNADITSEDLAY